MRPKIFVLAQSAQQAHVWSGLANIDPNSWLLLDEPFRLRGYPYGQGEVVVLPGAERRFDYGHLLAEARHRGLTITRKEML